MDARLTFVSAGITWFPWFSRSLGRQRTKGERCVDLLTASQCLTFPMLLLHCVITYFAMQGPAGPQGTGGQRGPNVSTAKWMHCCFFQRVK